MANHESAKKAHRQSLKRAARNRSIKSRVKTFVTNFTKTLQQGDLKVAATAFQQAESEIMKSVTKGTYHLNTASRKVSKLSHMLKKLEASASA